MTDRRPRKKAPPPARRVRAEPVEEPVEAAPAGEPRRVRLNKFLADHGVASRRQCDELIAGGQVSVDGEPVHELGLKIDPESQRVEIDGVVLKPKGARRRYYVLNKPAGVVCTSDVRETRPRAVDLITDPFKGRIYTVGRLDEESKGLILLTNDGEFANRIMHPRYGVQKTYLVKVAGEIDDDTLREIREGVHLSEGRTSGARILVNQRGRDHSLLTVQIREGMNRELRRVFARFGFKVTELKRIRIGPLTDRGLKPGRWRELTREEVVALVSGGQAEETAPARNKRARAAAPRRGYARHLVSGGRAVQRRPDADGRGPARRSDADVRGSARRPDAGARGADTGRGARGRPGPGGPASSGAARGRGGPGARKPGGGRPGGAGGPARGRGGRRQEGSR